jgi:hypothetical protein
MRYKAAERQRRAETSRRHLNFDQTRKGEIKPYFFAVAS